MTQTGSGGLDEKNKGLEDTGFDLDLWTWGVVSWKTVTVHKTLNHKGSNEGTSFLESVLSGRV